MFTSAQLAAAVSPETAVVIQDYPYGYTLRCKMRVWVEFKKGKGFRYCTQTTNPKAAGETWNKPKAGTYSRVSMAIAQDDNGHLNPVALSEYSDLPEYEKFTADHGANLSEPAAASLTFYHDVKRAYKAACAERGIVNIYDATPDQQRAVKLAYLPVIAAHVKAGTDY